MSSSHRNPPRSSSSCPNPPPSSLLLLTPPPSAPLTSMASSPALSASSGPGSPSSVDLLELEAALAASRSVPRLSLDPPVLTVEPPTSPESGDRQQQVPTSPPQALMVSSPRPVAKHQRGGSTAARKGKSREKEKVSASAPPQSLLTPTPSPWASLLAPPFPSVSSPTVSGSPQPSAMTTGTAPSSAPSTAPMAPMAPLPSLLPMPTLQHHPLSADQVLSLLQHPWISSLVANQPLPTAPGLGKFYPRLLPCSPWSCDTSCMLAALCFFSPSSSSCIFLHFGLLGTFI